MNARTALSQYHWLENDTIKRAKRVMKVKSMTYQEALDYGEKVDIKHATTEGEKAGIELRYSQIRKYSTTLNNNI